MRASNYPPGVTGAEPQITGEDETLGSCGCVDYHLADCPIRTGGNGMTADDYLDAWGSRDDDDFWDEP